MTGTLASQPPTRTAAGMGQIALTRGSDVAHSVLGSCVGIVLWDTRRKLGALAHVVLPSSEGRQGAPGKFVDTAVASMIASLKSAGADPKRLICKLAGGANMFSGNGPFQIGQQNIESAQRVLAELSVAIVAEHVGGRSGRRVIFECETGRVLVEIAGQPSVTL